MAAPSLKIFSVGMNAARYYALTSAGYPAATNATVYSGVSIGGPIALTLETTDPEVVTHPGNNAIQQYDVLPSQGVTGGTLVVSREDAATIAAFSNTKVHVISDFNMIGWQTSQQGNESNFALLAYDQAKDTTGARVWRTHVISRAIITPKPKGMARERGDIVYNLQPQICSRPFFGADYSASDNGYLTAQFNTITSAHRLVVGSWVTTATESEYVFDTDFPKWVTGDVELAVYKNKVKMTYGATADATHYQATTLKITFGAALTNGDIVTAIYGIADDAVDIDT
jgi:hypothetical protein